MLPLRFCPIVIVVVAVLFCCCYCCTGFVTQNSNSHQTVQQQYQVRAQVQVHPSGATSTTATTTPNRSASRRSRTGSTGRRPRRLGTHLSALGYDQVVSGVVSYEVTIPKPLGVVFGENRDPFYGLAVDAVTEGMNGDLGGLRINDQLLAVNERVVIGQGFDSVMALLSSSSDQLELLFYRGPVGQLYTILNNQDLLQYLDDAMDDGEGEEAVIMDENYVSPVRVEVKEQKPLTAGDVFKAFGKLGGMAIDTLTAPIEDADGRPQQPTKEQKKKKTGFFGIGGETVQLDSDEALGYKAEKRKPDDDGY